MLQVKLLGQFDVRRDGAPIVISSRLAQSLFALLILNPDIAHRREKLAGILWPDTSDDNARNNLRHELWRLRKALGVDSFIPSDDLSITFDSTADYWLDAAILARPSANDASVNDLTTTLDLYQGELLPGFYDDWVVGERERFHNLFEQKMARLLELLEQEQRAQEICVWAERWIALGQSPEPAYRALMQAHAALGNMSQVAEVYRRCVKKLRDDLGVEPSEQTRALYEKLKTRNLSSPALTHSSAPLPTEEPPAPGEPPFKGLRYYDEADADLFFGRERLIPKLVERLRAHPCLVVIGASGSGKSSLVRAGLISALECEGTWQTQVMTPTADPIEALAVSLTRQVQSATVTTTLMDDLMRDTRSLRLHLRKTLKGDERLLLVVDQFEELFTLCRSEEARRAFVDNLLAAIAPERDDSPRVVIALRADFYDHCAQYPNLRETVAEHQEYIGAMNVEELKEAIGEPARRGNWELEPGLVDLILRDVGSEPGALPLLSHALLETWKRRRGRVMTLKGYDESGGVRGAIAQTAESVFQRLAPERQIVARHIFVRLTELGEGTQDTRRRVPTSELVSKSADTSAAQAVLKILSDARLITSGEDTVEVAHEAVIREWPRLRDWLNQDREGLRLHRHLTEAAQSWDVLNRDEGELYRGTRLAQALDWANLNASELNLLEREFLDASENLHAREEAEREAQRQRELIAAQKLVEAERRRASILRLGLISSTLLLVVMIGTAIFAFSQRAAAESARVEAVAERDHAEEARRVAFVRELSVNAVNNLDVDPERSILLALQAVSVSAAGGKPVLRDAEEALHRAVGASRLQFTLQGHSASVRGVAFSPDGTRIATSSDDKSARIWDGVTGKQLMTLCCHSDIVYFVAFSPDGKRVATGSRDKTAKVWDATTGKELFALVGHTYTVDGVTFSPDGTRLATASGEFGTNSPDRTAKIWDAATGKELLILTGHTAGVNAVAFSPDGKQIATASDDRTTKIWDVATGKELVTMIGHVSFVEAVMFSPDGKRIVTAAATGDGTAKIWDSATGRLLLTVSHGAAIRSVAFDPTGTHIATSGSDGKAKVWDAVDGRLLLTLAGHTGGLRQLSISPDGTRLATASDDNTAKVWDISPMGGREWLILPAHNGRVVDVAYSSDGTRIATAGTDKTAKVWDAQSGKLLLTLTGHTDELRGIAFSPDGTRVATKSIDKTIKVWDAVTGKERLTIADAFTSDVYSYHVQYSPDGQRIVSSGANGATKIWDAKSGQEVLSVSPGINYIYGAAYSPDGKRIATDAVNSNVKIWDATSGQELLTLSGHIAIVRNVIYSADGRRLATVSDDSKAKVWDATNGQVLLTLSGHTGGVVGLAFSQDGSRLATGGTDTTVKVWNVSPGGQANEQPLTLYSNTQSVYGVAFSPDGKRLATASNDGTSRVYALPLDDIIAIAKSRVMRALTTDECQKFLHVDVCPQQP